jgi:hypothetical protein
VKVIPFDRIVGTACLDRDEVRRDKLSCDGQAEVRFSTRNEAPNVLVQREMEKRRSPLV